MIRSVRSSDNDGSVPPSRGNHDGAGPGHVSSGPDAGGSVRRGYIEARVYHRSSLGMRSSPACGFFALLPLTFAECLAVTDRAPTPKPSRPRTAGARR